MAVPLRVLKKPNLWSKNGRPFVKTSHTLNSREDRPVKAVQVDQATSCIDPADFVHNLGTHEIPKLTIIRPLDGC